MLGASFLLSVLFCLLAGHMLVGSLLCLCGRETRSAFLFEYSFASLISFRVFLATVCFSSKLSLLDFILFRAASCYVKLFFTYTCWRVVVEKLLELSKRQNVVYVILE